MIEIATTIGHILAYAGLVVLATCGAGACIVLALFVVEACRMSADESGDARR